MRLALQKLGGLIERFRVAREAVAAVEFALILPVMLSMYVGSIELAQAITIDQRVTTISGTIGDLVARNNGTIAASTLNDYFKAAQAIIGPVSNTSLTQVVSVVAVNSSGVTSVEWSKGYNGGVAKTANQPYTGAHVIPTAMINISKGSWIIVSEASYSYLPLLGIFFNTPFALYHQNFYLPRFAKDIPYNASG